MLKPKVALKPILLGTKFGKSARAMASTFNSVLLMSSLSNRPLLKLAEPTGEKYTRLSKYESTPPLKSKFNQETGLMLRLEDMLKRLIVVVASCSLVVQSGAL